VDVRKSVNSPSAVVMAAKAKFYDSQPEYGGWLRGQLEAAGVLSPGDASLATLEQLHGSMLAAAFDSRARLKVGVGARAGKGGKPFHA
jgi:hypothetical protein